MARRSPFASSEPAAFIPPPPGKTKRDRSWDRKHNRSVASYRGIPPELQAEIKQVADDLGISPGEVARAFLEFSLTAHRRGDLRLNPVPAAAKMTLFPWKD